MSILTNLFGASPFGALEAHGEKVHECLKLLKHLFQALNQGNQERLKEIAEQIFRLETEADQIRNQLHEMLGSRVLLPMGKEELFRILEHQDSMADRAEEVAAHLTYRDMRLPEPLAKAVDAYVDNVLMNCTLAAGIMSKLDLLVEASFAGRDAETVSKLITELAEREDAVKPQQIVLTRKVLADEGALSPVVMILWVQIIGQLAEISKHADRTGNGIRMTLRIKMKK